MYFNEIKESIGGNVTRFYSFGPLMPKEVSDFLKVVFCVPFYEGYSLNEMTGFVTINNERDLSEINVGGPLK